MKKNDVVKLCKKTTTELERVLLAPVVDPEAPRGYVRREVANAEIRKRIDTVAAVLDDLIDALYGDDELARHRRKKSLQR